MARVIAMRFGHSVDFETIEEEEPNIYTFPTPTEVVRERPLRAGERAAQQTVEYITDWLDTLSNIGGTRRAEAKLPPPRPAVAPIVPQFISPGPVPPRVAAPGRPQPKLELTPAAVGALRALETEREKQIKAYVSTPIGYVWQFDKKIPDHLTKIPIPRPPPSPGLIEEMFPRVRLPEAFAPAPQPPEPVRIFKGWLQVEGQPRINVWEDFAGNEVEGYRGEAGQFGEVFPLLEY